MKNTERTHTNVHQLHFESMTSALEHREDEDNVGVEAGKSGEKLAASTAHELQKKQIKRSYAARNRQTRERTAEAAKQTARKTEETIRRLVEYLKTHSKAAMVVLLLCILVGLLLGGLSSCAMMVGSGVSGMFSATYLSEDPAMLDAEQAYCDLEQQLQQEIDQIEETYEGYDQYVYDLDEIGHDPYVLISMLSALHDGPFTLEEVREELAWIFAHQYTLRLEAEGGTLTVTLENEPMERLPHQLLTEEQLSAYAAYMSNLGNREDLFAGVPGASTIVEPEYYEIPPEALEDETFAAMIAEGEKYLGYPYVWGGSSPDTSFDCSGFVCWVVNHCGWSVGRTTAQGLFNVCTPVSSTQVKPGDLIFFKGTYETTEVSHVGIYAGGGQMLHCGNPISYASVNVPYWQAHFYCFGRLP